MTRLTGRELIDHITWWADAYAKEGGHALVVSLLRDYARAIEAELAKQESVAQLELIGYQWQRLLGNPDVIEPFWDDWTDCTKEQYEHALAMPDYHGRAIYASHDDSLAPLPEPPDTVRVPPGLTNSFVSK